MKRILAILLIALLALSLGGCSARKEVDASKLVIWHDKEDAVVEALSAYLAEVCSGIEVTFEKKTSLTDSLKLVGNDPSAAPDMFIFAHDKVGVFAEMDILAPIEPLLAEDALANHLPMTLEAATYGGTLYQLPLYFETLLFSNQSSTSSPSNTARKLSSVSARGIKEKSELSSVFWALSATDSA